MKMLLLSCLLLLSDHAIAVDSTLLTGKWINSELDQLSIVVSGKQVIITRDIITDGIRPSSRRTYKGPLKDNMMTLFSQHEKVQDLPEILPNSVRSQLVKQKQGDKLILKILNDDNLRIDYYPTIVSFDSFQPNAITDTALSPDREIIRYKRWGRYTIEKVEKIEKNIAEMQAILAAENSRKTTIINQQIDQLQQKKRQLLQSQQNANIKAKEASLRQHIIDLQQRLETVTNTPLPKPKPLPKVKPGEENKAPAAIQPVIDHAAIKRKKLAKIQQQLDECIIELKALMQKTSKHSYATLPNLIEAQELDEGLIQVTGERATFTKENPHYQPPNIEKIHLTVDKAILYRSGFRDEYSIPTTLNQSATTFDGLKDQLQKYTPEIKDSMTLSLKTIKQGHQNIKSLENIQTTFYLNQINAGKKLPETIHTTTIDISKLNYALSCLYPKQKALVLSAPKNNQWRQLLNEYNDAFSNQSQKTFQRNKQDFLSALNGQHAISTLPQPIKMRMMSYYKITEQIRQKNGQWLKDIVKKVRKRKVIKKRKKEYSAMMKKTHSTLGTAKKYAQPESLKHLQEILAAAGKRQTTLNQASTNYQQWQTTMQGCAETLTPISMSHHDYTQASQLIQRSIMQQVTEAYWTLQTLWIENKIETAALAYQAQQLQQQLIDFQESTQSVALKVKRNSPFQRPKELILTLAINHWTDKAPVVKLKTHYQGLKFTVLPIKSKIAQIPGHSPGQYFQEIQYLFETNPFKHADMRSKLTLEVNFKPHQ
ncbi:MAG: hypothetical protein HOM11_12605 [Methylococcales bacterium]|jgi:hypothetical protein|nr:hypothetical protein [Methylococcales bacterium]MBT7445983.1 hypothetical protein [Methylococcales bacterium]